MAMMKKKFSGSDIKVGVLGGGQLGRMMGESAHRLGLTFTILDGASACAAPLAHNHIIGKFTDDKMVKQLSEKCDVVTVEIEHVNVDALDQLSTSSSPVAVYPSAATLRIIQDKLVQKRHLRQHNVAVADFVEVNSVEELIKAGEKFNYPMMLKTRKNAYDGRG